MMKMSSVTLTAHVCTNATLTLLTLISKHGADKRIQRNIQQLNLSNAILNIHKCAVTQASTYIPCRNSDLLTRHRKHFANHPEVNRTFSTTFVISPVILSVSRFLSFPKTIFHNFYNDRRQLRCLNTRRILNSGKQKLQASARDIGSLASSRESTPKGRFSDLEHCESNLS